MSGKSTVLGSTNLIDFLNRGKYIEQMFKISQHLAKNRQSASYALNGDWGIGKSFVLDMFEQMLNDQPPNELDYKPYLVLRFNCWEYDYYEEPLIAIVAAILESIENMQSLTDDDKNKFVGMLKSIGAVLIEHGIKWAENKLDVEEGQLKEFISALADGVADGQAVTKKAKEFDQYFCFKKALKALQAVVKQLSEKQTVMFLVDELDRCLPEYTVKVLERLHHLFEGISNVQMILAIDQNQLEHTIEQIYGRKTDAKKYLQKFIQFELKLDTGFFKDSFDRRFTRFSTCFTDPSEEFAVGVSDFIDEILNGLDMRRRIALVNRCEVVHAIIAGEGNNSSFNQDYLCLELFLTLLHDSRFSPSIVREQIEKARREKNVEEVMPIEQDAGDKRKSKDIRFDLFPPEAFMADERLFARPDGLLWITNVISNSRNYNFDLFQPQNNYRDIFIDSLSDFMLAIYARLLGFDVHTQGKLSSTYIRHLFDFGTEYWKLLNIVS